MKQPLADVLLNTGSVVLAFSCAFFAGLMILQRQQLEDLRLAEARDRATLPRGLLPPPMAADPDITGSITPRRSILTRRLGQPQVLDFKLLTVVDGLAYVQIDGPAGRELWPVGEGSVLPGAGRVISITRTQDRWQVTASHLTITGSR